jgi:hypothetical protein
MNWIKKNPAQFVLAIIAVLLLAGSYMVFSSVGDFPKDVVAKPTPPQERRDLPKPEAAKIDEAIANLGRPGMWEPDREKQGSLFVAKQVVNDNGRLRNPIEGYFNPPIPNLWLDKYHLDFSNPAVVDEDPDKDGFSTMLEFFGLDGRSHLSSEAPGGKSVSGADGKTLPDDSTSPIDAKDHPPYHTRLIVAEVVSISFRLRFMSADIDARNAQNTSVQINTVDSGRTYFVAMGALIPGTTYKVESIESKEVKDKDGVPTDAAVLTVVNTRNGLKVPLPKGQIVNSPESYTKLRYLWVAPGGQPTPEMTLQKDKTFSLPPELDKQYKVVEIKPVKDAQDRVLSGEVTILLPTGQTIVLKYPAPVSK